MTDDPNKRLRAAAHRLLCHTKEHPDGVLIKANFLDALDRALSAADAGAGEPQSDADWLAGQGVIGYSRVAGRPLLPVPPAVLETEDES